MKKFVSLLVLVGVLSGCSLVGTAPLETDRVILTIDTSGDGVGAFSNGKTEVTTLNGERYCKVSMKDYPFALGEQVDKCFRTIAPKSGARQTLDSYLEDFGK